MSVHFIFYFILITIFFIFKASESSKNEDDSIQLNINTNPNDVSNKRKLQNSYEPIRIKTIYLRTFINLVDLDYDLVNDSIEKAVNYIEELVSVRRLTAGITIVASDNQGTLLNAYLNTHHDADLIIFFNANYIMANDADISTLTILRKLNDLSNPNHGRPVIALIDYNVRFLTVYLQGTSA